MAAEAAVCRWGAHDRDEPFPLFAELRERSAVHEVTRADGHAAWLVVRGLTELPVIPGPSASAPSAS